MPFNKSFAKTQELAVQLSDVLLSTSTTTNKNSETVKELMCLSAELEFAQLALQNFMTSVNPPLLRCAEHMVVRCFDTLSQLLTIAMASVQPISSVPCEYGDTLLAWFRKQILELRTDLRRLLISTMLDDVLVSPGDINFPAHMVTGGVGGAGGPSNNGCFGGAGGNGEGPRLIADNFIIGTLTVMPGMASIPRGIQDHLFWVTDPVGGSIPISLRYSQTYAELERILKACLAGRPDAGMSYVERGEYAVVFKAGLKDGGFITQTNFAEKVEAGMQLENICPHCRCPQGEEAGCGWYKCTNDRCLRKYRIDAREVDCEELEFLLLAHDNEPPARSFRRFHIELVRDRMGDILPPPALSLRNRLLNWFSSSSRSIF